MRTYKQDKPLHSEMMIKVCGMKDPDNIRMVGTLTPMLMGFIFYGKSPRDASSLSPEIINGLPEFIRPVGVFVNATEDEIMDKCKKYGIRIVQLHGDETPQYCRDLKSKGLVVFKAVGISPDFDWDRLRRYEDFVDLFLFDNKTPAHGGSGQKFRWSLLDGYTLPTPYLLSGGIGPEDVGEIISAMRPGMAGIDINSRFEDAPGIKNISKLTHFILSLRKYNENESTSIPFWEKNK